ncbi:MAG: hypothetical protein J6N93_01855 [Clostridia bacterium]|nr:hypothetical protein [Clostridia bacterium]
MVILVCRMLCTVRFSSPAAALDETDNLKAIRHHDIITQNIIEQFYHMTVVSAYREWIRQRKIWLVICSLSRAIEDCERHGAKFSRRE